MQPWTGKCPDDVERTGRAALSSITLSTAALPAYPAPAGNWAFGVNLTKNARLVHMAKNLVVGQWTIVVLNRLIPSEIITEKSTLHCRDVARSGFISSFRPRCLTLLHPLK